MKENTDVLIVSSMETRLGVNADETKYIVMSQNQNAGGRHNMNIHNKSIEIVKEFKYLGTTKQIKIYPGRN